MTDAGGTQTLEVRKDKDKNVLRQELRGGGHLQSATADLGDALDKGLDDFRNKKVFDFGFSDPSKIDLKGANLHQEAATSGCPAGRRWTTPASRP